MTNALVRVELPPGAYTIMANSYGAGETGAYELSFAAGGSGGSGSNTDIPPSASASGA